jgi:hypothetical protein
MAKNGSEAAGALLNDHAAGHDLVLSVDVYMLPCTQLYSRIRYVYSCYSCMYCLGGRSHCDRRPSAIARSSIARRVEHLRLRGARTGRDGILCEPIGM